MNLVTLNRAINVGHNFLISFSLYKTSTKRQGARVSGFQKKVTMLFVMLMVNMCKSSGFSLRRFRSKVIGVACETGLGRLFCRFLRFVYITWLSLINVRRNNGTAVCGLLYRSYRWCHSVIYDIDFTTLSLHFGYRAEFTCHVRILFNPLPHNITFDALNMYSWGKHCENRRNCL